MSKMAAFVAALVAAAAAMVAEAAVPKKKRPPRAKVRGAIQRARIRDGIRDRELTPAEVARLRKEQLRIHEMAKAFASDGVVTPAERAKLEAAQNAASRHIAVEANDAQDATAPKRNWRVWDPRVNKRQHVQHLRIAQGIRTGSLTPSEASELVALEASLARMEAAMKSDGALTPVERKRLHSALDAASETIFELKHNDQAVHLRPYVVKLVNQGSFTRSEARELLAQLRRLMEIARILGGPVPLSAERRAALEAEFASLAAQVFN